MRLAANGRTCSLLQPLAATRSHSQPLLATCSHLQAGNLGKWLQQVAASGCRLQVAAWTSGCKWLLFRKSKWCTFARSLAIFSGCALAPVRFTIRTIQRISSTSWRETELPRDRGGGGWIGHGCLWATGCIATLFKKRGWIPFGLEEKVLHRQEVLKKHPWGGCGDPPWGRLFAANKQTDDGRFDGRARSTSGASIHCLRLSQSNLYFNWWTVFFCPGPDVSTKITHCFQYLVGLWWSSEGSFVFGWV